MLVLTRRQRYHALSHAACSPGHPLPRNERRPSGVSGGQSMIKCESIGIEEARRAIDAILAAVIETDSPVAIAIVDAHGDLICSLRSDGAAARMGRRSRAK